MTKQAIPELLDLAEAVASGELRPADAEAQLRVALEPDARAAEKAVRELHALILATSAVRLHALATRQAAAAESLAVADEPGTVSTVVRSSLRSVRRPSSRNGDGRGSAPRRTWLLLAATVAVGTGVIGASLLGGGLIAPKPGPTDSNAIAVASASLEPSPGQSVTAAPSAPSDTSSPARSGLGALIAYTRSTDTPNQISGDPTRTLCGDVGPTCSFPRVWVVGSDGRNPHELFPGGVGNQSALAWSPDGTRLLYWADGVLKMTDASGTEPQLVDPGCVYPRCQSDGGAAFSSDGAHLVFLRTPSDADVHAQSAVVTTLDLATGRVAELISSAQHVGMAPVGWSPDASRIVFSTFGDKDMGITGPIAPIKAAVFVVDADGQNLHQVSPATMDAGFGGWSPDGARIVFTSSETGGQDIYTVRPDRTDLRRLTSDGISSGATWMPDGRVLFVRGSAGEAPGFWTMDADGTNAAELLSAAVSGDVPFGLSWLPVWQPSGGAAIVPPPWNLSAATLIGPPPPTPLATPVPALAARFSRTGSLPAAASDHYTDTATSLNDGRVLVTRACEPTAQLYDPPTGTFSPTGPTTTRSGATATRLLDGRVLIAGGSFCGTPDNPGVLASAEIFDPQTATFSPTGSMGAARFRHTATLLLDGRVLITGGTTGTPPVATAQVVFASYRVGSHRGGAGLAATGSDVLATAELFDPQTGTFSPTGSMSAIRDRHTATLLQDGRVLVLGGGGESYDSLVPPELYDPATGTFSKTGSMAMGRAFPVATLLQDGRVLVTGGSADNGSTYASAELYDPSSGKFRFAGSMDGSRDQHTATVLQDGRVLIAGGYSSDGQNWTVLSSTDIFDPATGNFTALGSMGEARMAHVAALLKDGRLLIVGGTGIGTLSLVSLNSAVLYQP